MSSFFSKLFSGRASELLDNQTRGANSVALSVVGSSARLKQLLSFYRNNELNKSMQLIMQKGLLDFASSEEYTPGEMVSYKKGLTVVLDFLEAAHEEDLAKEKLLDRTQKQS